MNFINRIIQPQGAPEWFFIARKNNVEEAEIIGRIQIEIAQHADNKKFDPALWNQEFIAILSRAVFATYVNATRG